jgi:hypothetical protein
MRTRCPVLIRCCQPVTGARAAAEAMQRKSSTTQRSCTRSVPSGTERSLPPKPDPPTFRATALVQRTTNCASCYAFAPFSSNHLQFHGSSCAAPVTQHSDFSLGSLANNPNSSLLPSSELLRMQSASTVICMTYHSGGWSHQLPAASCCRISPSAHHIIA